MRFPTASLRRALHSAPGRRGGIRPCPPSATTSSLLLPANGSSSSTINPGGNPLTTCRFLAATAHQRIQQKAQQDARDAQWGYALSVAAFGSAFLPILLSGKKQQDDDDDDDEYADPPPRKSQWASKSVVCEPAPKEVIVEPPQEESVTEEEEDAAKVETPAPETTTTTVVSTTTPKPPIIINPLAGGVAPEQVEALVNECLADPTINIPSIPDFVERALYQTTIQLTLNLVYLLLGRLHGATILGHELQLQRISDIDKKSKTTSHEQSLSQLRDNLNEPLLEEMAARLVRSSQINQTLIPDALERQLYANCLKIIFRLLDLLSATMAVHVCGHAFQLNITPSEALPQSILDEMDQTATPANKMGTPVNSQLLLEYALAQRGGTDLAEQARQNQSFFGRLLFPFRQDVFLAQLQASLYGLFLALLDHVLEHSQIQLLAERVQFDIRALTEEERLARQAVAASGVKTAAGAHHDDDDGSGLVAFASFTMGVGVGLAAAMTYVLKKA